MNKPFEVSPAHLKRGNEQSALKRAQGYTQVTLPTGRIYGGKPVIFDANKRNLVVGGVPQEPRRREQ